MALGISDTVSSIALAMVPPGNLIRSIVELRKSLWSEWGAAGARAYFDYPVLAWLAFPLDGAALAGLASRIGIPFSLEGLERRGDDAFLGFSPSSKDAIAELSRTTPRATGSSAYRSGPFEAAVGCYCGSVAGLDPARLAAFDAMAVAPIRAKTYLLAQIELSWAPDDGMASSWATLSSARAGGRRR